MFTNKRLGKTLVCLICCLACLVSVTPAAAMNTSSLITGSSAAGAVPGLTLENAAVNSGHLVSVVHHSYYYTSAVIGCLENGTKITVLGTVLDFYKVDLYDMNGYIAKSQVAQNELGEYYVCCDENSDESKYLASYSTQTAMQMKSDLVSISQEYIGVRYVSGGYSTRGFDCSGFTRYVYEKIGVTLDTTALKQMKEGVVIAYEDLQPGDLIIFSYTGDGGFASHVGLYLGNDQMIHASSSHGVVIADLNHDYYQKHYQCARRVILSDVATAATLPSVNTITGSVGSGWRN